VGLIAAVLGAAGPIRAELPPQFLLQWGTTGAGQGEFHGPGYMAFHAGVVYVGNIYNHRVDRFAGDGTYLDSFGYDEMTFPSGIAIGPNNTVYVADSWECRIFMYTLTGGYLGQWGIIGHSNGEFYDPEEVAVDQTGSVYVCDRLNNRIQKFTSGGSFLTAWGSFGGGPGQFNLPFGVVTAGNYVFVSDNGNDRVEKFTTAGVFVSQFGSYGTGNGQFNVPIGICADGVFNLYVTDRDNSRVQKFTSAGIFLSTWGTHGTAPGEFSSPGGVLVDDSFHIYVADYDNDRVQKFEPRVILHSGMRHYPLGAASLLSLPDSTLAVTNLGPTGEDGVAVRLDDFPGSFLTLQAGNAAFQIPQDAGAEVSVTLQGQAPASAIEQVVARLRQSVRSDRVDLSCDFSFVDAPACTIEVRNGNSLVYSQERPGGQIVSVLPAAGQAASSRWNLRGSLARPGSGGLIDPTYTELSLGFVAPLSFSLSGELVTGDQLIFRRSAGNPIARLTQGLLAAAQPGGTSLDSLTLQNERAEVLGGYAASLGDANLSATEGSPAGLLVTTPADGSGARLAGRIDVVRGLEVSELAISASITDPDSANALPVGATLTTTALGRLDGLDGERIGVCRTTKLGNGAQAVSCCCWTPVGDDSLTGAKQIQVWLGGVLVSAGTTTSDTVAIAFDGPTLRSYDVAIPSLGTQGFLLAWPAPTQISVNGTWYVGDELRVGPAPTRTSAHPEGVQALAFTVESVPNLRFTRLNTIPLSASSVPPGGPSPGIPTLKATVLSNPSPGAVAIRLALPAAGRLESGIFDASGRLVHAFVDSKMAAGERTLNWDGRDQDGRRVPSGAYFLRGALRAPGGSEKVLTQQLIIVR
jgi:hypothetical protein